MLKKLILITGLLLSFNSYAEDMKIYEANLEIDASANDASQAREKALAEANRKALYAVTNRISTEQSTQIFDDLNDNQILNFIYDVSVLNEKVVDARYIASLKITINAPILKSYLSEKDIPISILPQTQIIIVPIYRQSETSAPLLWEDENIWYTAWQEHTQKHGQISILPIEKNESYKEILGAEDAIQLNGLGLDSIKHKSNADNIYVAEVTAQNNNLSLVLKSLTGGTVLSKIYEYQTNITFDKPIQDINTFIIEQIQKKNLSETSQQNALTLIYNFNSLKEWMTLKNQLKTITSIQETTIDAMSGQHIQITINFTGPVENLIQDFHKYGFSLNNNGNFYKLERQ